MVELALRALNGESGELEPAPLSLDDDHRASVSFRSLPGASALHLELTEGGEVVQRLEVDVEGEEHLRVHLERSEQGTWEAWSRGRGVVSLLRDRRYAPLPVLPGGEDLTALDLMLVIDGTTRVYETPEAGRQSGSSGEGLSVASAGLRPLLAREEPRREHVDALVGLGEALAAEVDSLRVGFLAFGDHEVNTLRAPGLRPRYHLYPRPDGAVRFRSFDADALREGLLGIPPCSGGDVVDALADALDRCVELRWREDARRVVLVTGDSPGHSILRPAPRGADLQAREKDVETLALALHRAGVQTATVYHRPAPEGGFETLAHASALIEHAAAQYRRIASRADLAFEVATFEPVTVAERILSPPPLMGRGPSYGVLVEDG